MFSRFRQKLRGKRSGATVTVLLAMLFFVAACADTASDSEDSELDDAASDEPEEADEPEEGDQAEEAQSQEVEYEWRWATNTAGPDTSRGQIEQQVADFIEEESDGRISIDIGWGGSIGAEQDALESAQAGTVQLATSSSSNSAALVPAYSRFDMPFLIQGNDGLAALAGSDPWNEVTSQAEERGLKQVGVIVEGWRNLLTSPGNPVTTLDDLTSDIRLRTTESQIEAAYVRALGMSATPMAWDEVYLGMTQGVIDGHHNPYTSIVNFGHQDSIGHSMEYEIVPLLMLVHVSLDAYDSLPPELQEVVDGVNELSLELSIAGSQTAEDEFRQELVAEFDLETVVPDDAMLAELREMVVTVYEEFPDIAPEEWVERARAVQSSS